MSKKWKNRKKPRHLFGMDFTTDADAAKQRAAIRKAFSVPIPPNTPIVHRLLVVETEFFRAGAVWRGSKCIMAAPKLHWMLISHAAAVKLALLKMDAQFSWVTLANRPNGRFIVPRDTLQQVGSSSQKLPTPLNYDSPRNPVEVCRLTEPQRPDAPLVNANVLLSQQLHGHPAEKRSNPPEKTRPTC